MVGRRPLKVGSKLGAECRVLSAEFQIFFVAVSTSHSEPSTPHPFPPSPQGRVGTGTKVVDDTPDSMSPSPQGRVKSWCGVRSAECEVSTSFPYCRFQPQTPIPEKPDPISLFGFQGAKDA